FCPFVCLVVCGANCSPLRARVHARADRERSLALLFRRLRLASIRATRSPRLARRRSPIDFFPRWLRHAVHPLSLELLPSARVCARAAREPSEPDCPQKPIGSRLKAIEKFVEANFASAETIFRAARAP